MDYDMDAASCSAIVLGTGCMPNCNFALVNAGEGKVRCVLIRLLQFIALLCVPVLNLPLSNVRTSDGLHIIMIDLSYDK